MDQLLIDRLALHVPGISEDDGARLSRLIADGLFELQLGETSSTIPALRLHLQARPGESMEALAARIVADIARHLARLG